MLLGHALVRDEKGEEMHKSRGNSIPSPRRCRRTDEPPILRALRMFCRHNPVNNINFGYGPAKELHMLSSC